MKDEQIKDLAERNGWNVECFSPLELANRHGDFISGGAAQALLLSYENEPQYITAGYIRFFRKCQKEGWNKPNTFITIRQASLKGLIAVLSKALAGEQLCDHDSGSTYSEFGGDVTITIQSSPDENVLVFPCHQATLEWLTGNR